MNQVSVCPKCGAPIYMPSDWHGELPVPMASHACTCAEKAEAQQREQMVRSMHPRFGGPGMTPPQV